MAKRSRLYFVSDLHGSGKCFRKYLNGAAIYNLEEGDELRTVEQLVADHGYYPYRADPGELAEMEASGTLDSLFLTLISARLQEWLQLADERLRPRGIPIYWMLGNDDPPELTTMLDEAPWGTHCEGHDVLVGDR